VGDGLNALARLLGDGQAELRPARAPHQPDWLLDQLEAQRLRGGKAEKTKSGEEREKRSKPMRYRTG
jgi:hypothetical protein